MVNNQRQSRSKRKSTLDGIQVTERDIHILRAIYDYGYLSTKQIQWLFFPSLHQAYDRLRKLYDHGLVNRVMLGVRMNAMNTPMLYVLDKLGFEVVQQSTDDDLGSWKQITKKPAFQLLAHNMALNDIRIAAYLSCQKYGWQLSRWRGEHELRQMNISVPLSASQNVILVPDSYFQIDTDTQSYRYFLEVDMGTMTLKRFQEKVIVYRAYQQVEQNRHIQTKFRVLTTAPTQKRALNLKKVVELAEGQGFLFTTLDQLTSDGFFVEPIWWVAGHPEQSSLV